MIENFIFLFIVSFLGFYLAKRVLEIELDTIYLFFLAAVIAVGHAIIELANWSNWISFLVWIIISYISNLEITKNIVEDHHKFLISGFIITFILAGLLLLIGTFVFLSL